MLFGRAFVRTVKEGKLEWAVNLKVKVACYCSDYLQCVIQGELAFKEAFRLQ